MPLCTKENILDFHIMGNKLSDKNACTSSMKFRDTEDEKGKKKCSHVVSLGIEGFQLLNNQ